MALRRETGKQLGIVCPQNMTFKARGREKQWKVITSETFSHEDLVSQGVAQNHTHELPVPGPLDVLAALTAAVGRVILEGEGNPDRFSTWGAGGE